VATTRKRKKVEVEPVEEDEEETDDDETEDLEDLDDLEELADSDDEDDEDEEEEDEAPKRKKKVVAKKTTKAKKSADEGIGTAELSEALGTDSKNLRVMLRDKGANELKDENGRYTWPSLEAALEALGFDDLDEAQEALKEARDKRLQKLKDDGAKKKKAKAPEPDDEDDDEDEEDEEEAPAPKKRVVKKSTTPTRRTTK
jgi:hypothetical protein